jgi:hypothetical protein
VLVVGGRRVRLDTGYADLALMEDFLLDGGLGWTVV